MGVDWCFSASVGLLSSCVNSSNWRVRFQLVQKLISSGNRGREGDQGREMEEGCWYRRGRKGGMYMGGEEGRKGEEGGRDGRREEIKRGGKGGVESGECFCRQSDPSHF